MNSNQKSGSKLFLVVFTLVLLSVMAAPAAQAQTRLVVRDSLGLPGLNLTCVLLGCHVVQGLGDPQGQLFVITFPAILDPVTSLLRIQLGLGILSVELDPTVNAQGAQAGTAPYYLTDKAPTAYYGNTVWHGYVAQPATELIRN